VSVFEAIGRALHRVVHPQHADEHARLDSIVSVPPGAIPSASRSSGCTDATGSGSM